MVACPVRGLGDPRRTPPVRVDHGLDRGPNVPVPNKAPRPLPAFVLPQDDTQVPRGRSSVDGNMQRLARVKGKEGREGLRPGGGNARPVEQ
eukprot:8992123-Alexandrium_andersonii.AAC.1